MRILHVIQRYWPARGGAETHLGEISDRLAVEGHQVTVATTDALDAELFWDPRRRRIAEREGRQGAVRIVRFPIRHLPLCPLTYHGWRRLLWILSFARPVPVGVMTYLSRFTPWVPELGQWLDSTREAFDVVAGMTTSYESIVEMGLRFARKRQVPFIIYPLTHFGAGKRPGQDALGRFYTMRHQVELVRASDAVIAQTQTEQTFYDQQGVPGKRITVIGPGINPGDLMGGNRERFLAKHKLHSPIAFSISSMNYDKGTHHTIEAIRSLWHAGHDITLVLAGAILKPFQAYLDTLPHQDRQRLLVLGSISDEEKRDLLAAGDVLVMPSRTDSFGIAYLEAWLYGKPVIGAQTWGVNDLIEHEQDGLLIPFGDVEALSSAILHLVAHPESARLMGARGRDKTLHRHTWDIKYPLVRDLYLKLVAARQSR